ncbi:TasA family protein [Thermococcus radiotolerans]|uniref:Uncharacterized protein n=1 Tax=Thermococcus radiotolerans TaxID=187880 RepID=A0A2Z2N3P5_9EURY|nr:TasA family protein [Thermococcus radiotolerans]ASJ15183.1 hypothetical protein A3L10_08600 [Thermococcus radiotolerans]
MRRFPLVVVIVAVLAISILGGAGTFSVFSDTETSSGNVIAAGTLDLKVWNGTHWVDDPNVIHFEVSNMAPGDKVTWKFKLKNSGTLPGNLSFKFLNIVSHENGLLEPEIENGDVEGEQVTERYTHYKHSSDYGDGELWDQLSISVYVDENDDGEHQWYERTILSKQFTDYSSTYSIPNNTYIPTGIVLGPGENVTLLMEITFKGSGFILGWDENWTSYGININNVAMSDSVEFDLEFKLTQTD